MDLMSSNPYAPAEVVNGIIDTLKTSVTNTLHGISTKSARGTGLVTFTHKNWVCSVSEVKAAGHFSLLESANLVSWGYRESKSSSRHGLWNSFEGNNGKAVCQA